MPLIQYRQKAKGSMQGQAVFHVKHWPQLHGPQAHKHILSRSPLPPCHFREVFRQRSAMHKSSPAHPALRLCFAAGLQITACAPASDVSRETGWRQSARSVLRTCMISSMPLQAGTRTFYRQKSVPSMAKNAPKSRTSCHSYKNVLCKDKPITDS